MLDYKNIFKSLTILSISILFTACGGGGGGGENGKNTSSLSKITGKFIDDPVKGLLYDCSSGTSGITNIKGEYTCNAGDTVTFKIGSLVIGSISAQTKEITPYSLFPNDNNAALNLAKLLQSLDNKTITNVIVINETLRNKIPANTNFSNNLFKSKMEKSLGINLIDSQEARKRMHDSIAIVGGSIPTDLNHIPVANAGIDQSVILNSIVKLDGSQSKDMDLDSLTYSWSFINKPINSTAKLSDSTIVNPIFTADLEGNYILNLIVNDGTFLSSNNTVTITVNKKVSVITNKIPSISITPKPKGYVNSIYHIKPTANDEDGDVLTFSIENKPSWAQFNSTNGLLWGTPNKEQNNTNIIISVNDQKTTSKLDPFNILIEPTLNITDNATPEQGSNYGSYQASYAIDDDISTFNHTQCNSEDNWWQLDFKETVTISHFDIKGRNSNVNRINNAKVYISNSSYSTNTNSIQEDALLQGTANEQSFVLNSPKKGRYLIVKATNSECLHMENVEVFGAMPNIPSIVQPEKSNFIIDGKNALNIQVIKLDVKDFQKDTLSYHVNDNHFEINSKGVLTIKNKPRPGVYPLIINVKDGLDTNTINLSVTITSTTAVEDALNSGKVDKVTSSELLDAILEEISSLQNFMQDDKKTLFNLNSDGSAKNDGSSLTNISWNPTHDTAILKNKYGHNTPLLFSNAVTTNTHTIYEKPLAILGQKTNSKYIVFGSNPLRNISRDSSAYNEDMNKFLKNSINYLSKKTDNIKAVITHLDQSYYFPDQTAVRTWLDNNYTNMTYNNAESCDGINLDTCIDSSVNLLIISQVSLEGEDLSKVSKAVNKALELGIGVLYFHHNGDLKPLGKELFNTVFDVEYDGDNIWKRLSIEHYNPITRINTVPQDLQDYETFFTHLKNNDFNIDMSLCDDKGRGDLCTVDERFFNTANNIRSEITSYDTNKIKLFPNVDKYRLQKLMILIGDSFKEDIQYPMDKITTNLSDFLRSSYSDKVLYNYRTINNAQKDMGNFSRSDFSHITPSNKNVNLISNRNFRSTGVYAIPGKTMTITRNDNESVTTKIQINSIRQGATHQFQKNGYNRPKHLTSTPILISNGETIQITSSYGGPVHILFNQNNQNVSFTFKNIGEHAYWKSSADDTSFTQKLAANEYDWAEIVTSGFEVHSTLEKMKKSITNWTIDPTAASLAAATKVYMSNYPHVLAGYQGPGIDIVSEIHDFAKDNDLSINTMDKVKHMNADQAACGYGCSGNPYDAYWAFSPVGHGDIHELGHGLESGRLRMIGWEGHSTTNPYSYYSKTQYNKKYPKTPTSCQTLPFKNTFDALQASINEINPSTYLDANLWPGTWSNQVLFTIQAMMSVEDMGLLIDGWHLLARLHILDRNYGVADNNETNWNTTKSNLGFDTYAYNELSSITKNDWMLISMSFASKADFRDYFKVWGIPYTQKADSQVASFAYNKVPLKFYMSKLDKNGNSNGYCLEDTDYGNYLDKQSILLDGVATWINH